MGRFGMARERRSDRRRTGRLGELLACGFFLLRGYRIIARNLRVPSGELDLLVRRGRRIHVVEVRTVRSEFFACPAHAVTPTKCAQVRRVVDDLCRKERLEEGDLSLDILGVRLRRARLPVFVWRKNEI